MLCAGVLSQCTRNTMRRPGVLRWCPLKPQECRAEIVSSLENPRRVDQILAFFLKAPEKHKGTMAPNDDQPRKRETRSHHISRLCSPQPPIYIYISATVPKARAGVSGRVLVPPSIFTPVSSSLPSSFLHAPSWCQLGLGLRGQTPLAGFAHPTGGTTEKTDHNIGSLFGHPGAHKGV